MNSKKYYIIGTLTGSQSYETFTDDITAMGLIQWYDEIKEFIEDEKTELAQYIDDRYACIKGVVTEIYVGVTLFKGGLCSLTEVTATRELNNEEKIALLDYLTGQFSDGWGEGVEQREFATEVVTEEEECYDEEEDCCYTEEYDVTTHLYLHFWQPKGFMLAFHTVTPEVGKDEEIIEILPKPKCKLIGADGNIFNLLGIARRALTRVGLREQADEMIGRATKANSYDEAIQIIMEYVEVE